MITSIQDTRLTYASVPLAWYPGEASKSHNFRWTNCGRKLGQCTHHLLGERYILLAVSHPTGHHEDTKYNFHRNLYRRAV